MNLREIIDSSPPYLLTVGALICFILAISFAIKNEIAAAGLMSALFFLCVVLAYFPQLDSVKAFSVDVRLRKSLDRAEDILARLRNLSIVSAGATYQTVAWSNRWGGMAPKDKQDLLDAVDAQLEAMGVKGAERKEIAKPYVELIGYDLYGIFYQSARSVLWHMRATPTEAEGAKRLTQWEQQWRPPGLESFGRHARDGTSLNSYMKQAISGDVAGEDDVRRLEKLAGKIEAIFDGCVKRDGYTEDALQFVNLYGSASHVPEQLYEFFVTNNP